MGGEFVNSAFSTGREVTTPNIFPPTITGASVVFDQLLNTMWIAIHMERNAKFADTLSALLRCDCVDFRNAY